MLKKHGIELGAPLTQNFDIDIDALRNMITDKTALVSICHVSNTTGTVNPIRRLLQIAHKKSALVCVDGAQGSIYNTINVEEIGCDFYCFSAHKLFEPNGLGVCYIHSKHTVALSPVEGGGEMIDSVSYDGFKSATTTKI